MSAELLCDLARETDKCGGRMTDAERFWAKVEKTETCWLWTAGSGKRGYGRFHLNGKTRQAHRVSWLLKHGGFPPAEMLVCHTCDNPPCVNPEHLFLGATTDNMRDMMRKHGHYQTKKTHCPYGHEYTPDNIYAQVGKYGAGRECATCRRSRALAKYHQRRRLEERRAIKFGVFLDSIWRKKQ